MLDIFSGDAEIKHEWIVVEFSHASPECACGFVPENRDEYEQHSKENNILIDIPGERHENPHKKVATYDVNPIHDGVDSSGIVQHTSMVAAVRDMVGLIKGEAELTEKLIYGWHIQYNDGGPVKYWAEYVLPEDESD